jgi:sigma-E factor negative regulatory protein RseA
MDDRLKETLSAMMDNQADELSIRRLLSCPDRDEVCDQWRRWQRLQNLMHDGVAESVDVSARVREEISGSPAKPVEDNPAYASGPARTASRWPVPAMVALALTLGFAAGSGWDIVGGGASAQPQANVETVNSVSLPDKAQREEQTVAQQRVPEIALQGLNDEQRQHLGRYLLEHAQHSSVAAGRGSLGYARLTSMSADSEPY